MLFVSKNCSLEKVAFMNSSCFMICVLDSFYGNSKAFSCYWVAYGKPVEVCVDFVVFLFFSVSVKVLPVTPLVSGVFVQRAF